MTRFRAGGIGHDRSALHFDNALSPSIFLLLPLLRLTV